MRRGKEEEREKVVREEKNRIKSSSLRVRLPYFPRILGSKTAPFLGQVDN